jgi:hypothetical protein
MRPIWIRDLKVGDKVLTIEKGHNVPGIEPNSDGLCILESVSVIIKIETNYIETEFVRAYNSAWENFERAYSTNCSKNYFAPDGSINIRPLK